jgi:hypothetical protein
MHIETFKYVGSVHFLPFVVYAYDSTICEKALSFGWLWWGMSIVKKNGMHL